LRPLLTSPGARRPPEAGDEAPGGRAAAGRVGGHAGGRAGRASGPGALGLGDGETRGADRSPARRPPRVAAADQGRTQGAQGDRCRQAERSRRSAGGRGHRARSWQPAAARRQRQAAADHLPVAVLPDRGVGVDAGRRQRPLPLPVAAWPQPAGRSQPARLRPDARDRPARRSADRDPVGPRLDAARARRGSQPASTGWLRGLPRAGQPRHAARRARRDRLAGARRVQGPDAWRRASDGTASRLPAGDRAVGAGRRREGRADLAPAVDRAKPVGRRARDCARPSDRRRDRARLSDQLERRALRSGRGHQRRAGALRAARPRTWEPAHRSAPQGVVDRQHAGRRARGFRRTGRRAAAALDGAWPPDRCARLRRRRAAPGGAGRRAVRHPRAAGRLVRVPGARVPKGTSASRRPAATRSRCRSKKTV
jgi:hypothetical protein